MKDQIKIEKTEQTIKTRTIDVVQALSLTDDEIKIIDKTYNILIDQQTQIHDDNKDYYPDDPSVDDVDLNWYEYQGALIDRSELTLDVIKNLWRYSSILMDVDRYIIFKSDLIMGLKEWAHDVSSSIRYDKFEHMLIDDVDWNSRVDEYVLIRNTIKKLERSL